MSFMDKVQAVLNNRTKVTENGALGYKTSKSALVDLNFAVASLRNASKEEIVRQFVKAFHEDRVLAMKWLFFLRDVRGGLGERRTFRVIIKYLATAQTEMMAALVEIMAEYGRFDDLLVLCDTPVESQVIAHLSRQLQKDMENMEKKAAVSLCAKWMPGNNTSSEESKRLAAKLQKAMGLTAKEYRKMLSALRAYMNVTEVLMSDNRWEEIEYSAVSSKANVLYRKAFLAHDKDRREAFLEAANAGEAVIHAGVLMPHDIVQKYTVRNGYWNMQLKGKDAALEALWKNLPDVVQGAENVLCVVDGSGSMMVSVGNTMTTALHVSNALGIYFAERMKGAYRDKFITFSSQPEYVDLSKCRSLCEKLEVAFSHTDCSNTNLEATFDLILETAVKNRLSQKELPQTILVISDMEFDQAMYGRETDTLFETISKKFARYGYKLPRLVFWNVNSRTNVIPVRENEFGVGLVSGFSVNICQMVMSGELSPYKALVEMLSKPRYQVIEKYVS